MLLTIQFPLADSRPFLPGGAGALTLPQWPVPALDKDFVRGFGIVRKRKLGGLKGWVGESRVCDARRGLRLPNFCWKMLVENGSDRRRIKLDLAFRRFFADGLAVGKYEIGFSNDDGTLSEFTRSLTGAFVQKILNLPVTMYAGSETRSESRLITAGTYLARSYALCTTENKPASRKKLKQWWVDAGVPLLFLIYDEAERLQLPFIGKVVPFTASLGCTLSFHYVPHEGSDFPFWVMGMTSSSDKEAARALRISLSRLHAERECLRLILRNLATGKLRTTPRSNSSDVLQRYFNESTGRLRGFATEADEIADTDVAQLARESSEQVDPGERDSLLSALRNLGMRANVFHKIKEYVKTQNIYMGDNINVSGGGGQGNIYGRGGVSYGNVFNQWNNPTEGRDLAKLTEELETLRTKLKAEASSPEHDAAVGAVAQAQVEAKKGNGEKAFAFLAQAGKWALDVAKTIAVPIASEALKTAIGMPG